MDHGVSGPVATRPAGSGRSSGTGKSGTPAERKSGATTRPGPGRPLTARSDSSRPGQRPLPLLVPGTRRPGPCAQPHPAVPRARGVSPSLRRPWSLGLERLTVPPPVHASIEEAVVSFVRARATPPVPGSVPGSGVTYAASPDGSSRLPVAGRCTRIGIAVRRWFHSSGRGAEPAGGRRVAEIVFSVTIGALVVLLALAVVSTVLPGAVALSAVGIGSLAATGGFAGYSSWRWVRWMRDRTDRMHWSVIAAAGAATTAAEFYGAAAIVASHSGFLERVTAFGGLGFVAALTVAVTGAAALVSYHRSVTDAQLVRFARRFA